MPLGVYENRTIHGGFGVYRQTLRCLMCLELIIFRGSEAVEIPLGAANATEGKWTKGSDFGTV